MSVDSYGAEVGKFFLHFKKIGLLCKKSPASFSAASSGLLTKDLSRIIEISYCSQLGVYDSVVMWGRDEIFDQAFKTSSNMNAKLSSLNTPSRSSVSDQRFKPGDAKAKLDDFCGTVYRSMCLADCRPIVTANWRSFFRPMLVRSLIAVGLETWYKYVNEMEMQPGVICDLVLIERARLAGFANLPSNEQLDRFYHYAAEAEIPKGVSCSLRSVMERYGVLESSKEFGNLSASQTRCKIVELYAAFSNIAESAE